MQQKLTSHASTKSYGQPMFVWAANQMGEYGTTLIARQAQVGPGSWTLARAGGQFNSRGPYPLGSCLVVWEAARAVRASHQEQGAGSRVQGRLDLNCWATLSLSDEAFHPISLSPLARLWV